MNRGLILALLLLAFVITFIGADTILISEAITESATALEALDPLTPPTPSSVSEIRYAYDEHRLLLSLSIPHGYLNEYEEALASLCAATMAGEAEAYATARAQAITALSQIKRSALFSVEQIF